MAYQVRNDGHALTLELKGVMTIRHAAELAKALAASFKGGIPVTVRSEELEDLDTCILQMLVSLRKTAESFVLESPSPQLVQALERCALRRELLGARDGE